MGISLLSGKSLLKSKSARTIGHLYGGKKENYLHYTQKLSWNVLGNTNVSVKTT